METATEVKKFSLPKKTVLVKPIRRKGSWLPKGHEAEFLFKHSYISLVVPKLESGGLKDPLTEEERNYFESPQGGLSLKQGDMSVYKKQDNFWIKFRVKLDKNVVKLDLSNPMEYLKYKVLLSNSELVAPSADQELKKATYKFVLVEEGWENQELVKASKGKKEAYRAFGKMDSSPEKMKDFLSVYFLMKPGGKSVPINATHDFLIGEIEKIIEADIDTFLEIIEDRDYDMKVLINKALKVKALEREKQTYRTPEGKTIGESLSQAINFLTNPLNSEEVIKIQSRIENSKL